MGLEYPKYPAHLPGDEQTESPTKHQQSLLGSERGTDYARRLETDANRNLYVHVAADDTASTNNRNVLLHSGSTGPISANTPTTISSYTAPSAKVIRWVKISGEAAADYTLRINLSTKDISRTNLELDTIFEFKDGIDLSSGDVLDVRVEHHSLGHSRNFNMFVYGE